MVDIVCRDGTVIGSFDVEPKRPWRSLMLCISRRLSEETRGQTLRVLLDAHVTDPSHGGGTARIA